MVLVAADVIGAPCWLSLVARDREAAERFYGAVLGWTFRQGGMFGRAFSLAEDEGVPVAGIGAVAGEFAVPVVWTPYFAVDEADAAVARVRERGGTVGVGPVTYPAGGRAALVTDQEGAVFGIWDGDVLSEWTIGAERSPAWIELHARNAFDSAIFYGEVLGWGEGDGDSSCATSYEEDQVVLRRQGRPVARMNSGPVEQAAPKPQLRPRWLVHFRVEDLDEAVSRALEHGGSTLPDADWADSPTRQVTVRDPDGALFTLDQATDAD
ncbi:VOC family protein [Streptomyces sp. LHD-70]|uniref:VOC family protein n=1 Tax=Streptomyces sp. LHD-70 TaxID=3072140 RepID=UPI00280D2C34|nr:VOC family protein [Streptomyces sp. LHD-70]MDQ8704006.1 VOC family protein [Streptomyces sp. LHD-70]